MAKKMAQSLKTEDCAFLFRQGEYSTKDTKIEAKLDSQLNQDAS